MLVLAGLGLAVAVVLIFALRGGDDDGGGGTTDTAANTNTQTSTNGVSNLPEGFESQVNLTGSGGNTLAVVYVLKTGDKRTLAIAGQGFQRTTQTRNYAVWLYNSATDAQRLGFAPPIAADGRLAAGVDAGRSPRRPSATASPSYERLLQLQGARHHERERRPPDAPGGDRGPGRVEPPRHL